ncbi:unnamed protein product [Boreogadus saida]
MVANLKMRYKESGEWLLLNKAALLDPRFSRLVHLSPAQKHVVTESLSHELTETETDTTRDQQRRHGDGMEDPPTDGGVTATYIRNSDKMYVYSRRVDKFVWIRRLPYVAVRTPELGGRSPAQ